MSWCRADNTLSLTALCLILHRCNLCHHSALHTLDWPRSPPRVFVAAVNEGWHGHGLGITARMAGVTLQIWTPPSPARSLSDCVSIFLMMASHCSACHVVPCHALSQSTRQKMEYICVTVSCNTWAGAECKHVCGNLDHVMLANSNVISTHGETVLFQQISIHCTVLLLQTTDIITIVRDSLTQDSYWSLEAGQRFWLVDGDSAG